MATKTKRWRNTSYSHMRSGSHGQKRMMRLTLLFQVRGDLTTIIRKIEIIVEFTTLEEEGDTTELENIPTSTPTNLHMSSLVISKCMINSLEQESSDESTCGSTIEHVPKKFHSLAEICANTLEEELDPDELVLLAGEEPTSYCEAATETIWKEAMQKELELLRRTRCGH